MVALCLGGAISGCSHGGQVEADMADAGHPPPPIPADLAVPAPRLLLKSFSGCPDEMFQSERLVDDFDSQATLDANWNWRNDGRFPRPKLGAGSLAFGPHNLDPSQWWNNWSPLVSLAAFDDVLYCVRYRVKPASGLQSGDQVFETSVRGDSGGMALSVGAFDSLVTLHTRTSDTTFVQHGQVPLAFQLDVEQTVEVALWAHGNHYYAEAKNVDSGAVVAMAVDYTMLQPQGIVAMLGWRLKNAVLVDRAIVGTPGALAGDILSTK